MISLLAMILIPAMITMILRALPFIALGHHDIPPLIDYIGKVLPPAIMVTLVVYCYKNVSFFDFYKFFPTLIATIVVIVLHIYKKNTIISVLVGTLVYMIFIHL